MARMSIRQEVEKALKDRRAFGRSKHDDKMHDKADRLRAGAAADKMNSREKYYFYNRGTYEVYVRKAVAAFKYINEQVAGHRISFNEAGKYIEMYLDTRKDAAMRGEITPRTLAKERSQLSKVWQVNLDSYKILPCHAESYKGRGSDRYYNPNNHKEQLDFYRAIGARKNEYRDLTRQEVLAYKDQVFRETGIVLTPDLHGRTSNLVPIFGKDNLVEKVVVSKAKHGKTNVVEILPQNRQMVSEAFITNKFRDFFNPSDHCNVHQCRREYAQAMYQYYARDITTLRTDQLYICRGRYTGRIYDREAVARVAVCLGHTQNDLFDTIHNYLR